MRGKITKQDLSESLIEEIENSIGDVDLSNYPTKEELQEAIENVDVDLSNYTTKEDLQEALTDDSLLTNDKSLAGAINELFQSANNGKQLIASAIGTPLNAEATFDAMSNDINSLLSTFKTNMMNNGVVVGSSDKFKSLIDKIATMAGNNSGKGIQFAEGSGSWKLENGSYSGQSVTITTNLNFTPTYVFVYGEYAQLSASMMMMGNASLSIDNIIVSNLGAIGASDDTTLGRLSISDITANSFKLKSSNAYYYKISATKWYAIGVGEEDTTLRDSLASILVDEGVSVTEEDDMASLISKVDEEFTDKNNKLSGMVSPAGTAVASDVLRGKTFINSTGKTVTGSMTNQGSKTITPKSTNQTLAAGYYSGITINGNTNLKAANIVEGVTIFGVTGTAKTGGYYFNSDNTGVAEVTLHQDNGEQTYTAYGTWSTIISLYTSAIEGRVKFVFQAASGGSTVRLKKISGSTTTYPTQTAISGSNYKIYSLTVDVTVGDKIQLEVKPSEGYPYYKRGVTLITNVCEY